MMDFYFRYVLELGIVLPAAFFAFLPVRDRLRYPARVIYPVTGVVLLAFILICAALCAVHDWDSNILLLPCTALFFIFYVASVNISVPKKCFCFFTAALLTGFCTMYTNFITAPFESEAEPFAVRSSAICYGLIVIGIMIFYVTLAKRIPYVMELDRLEGAWIYLMLVPLTLTALVFWMTPLHPANVLVGRIRRVSLVLMLLIPILYYAFCLLLWWLTRKLTESARLEQENDILRLEQKRYDALQRYMDKTRTLRHDFRQHLAVINDLHAAGERDQLTAYLNELIPAAQAEHRRYCENRAADALIAHYDEMAAARDAVIEWTVNLPEQLCISEVEFCAMLGNLLDNALNAVFSLPPDKRVVRVGCEMSTDSILTLCIDNPYTGTVRFGRNGLPRARRSDHGVGMASVSATVARYHGTMALRAEGGVFSVEIVVYGDAGEADPEDSRG